MSYCFLIQVELFGSAVSVWKILALLSGPWSVSRLLIMVYLLVTSLSKIADQDSHIRLKKLQEVEDEKETNYKMSKDDKLSCLTKTCSHSKTDRKVDGRIADGRIVDYSVNNKEFINNFIPTSNIVLNDEGLLCIECTNEHLSHLFCTRKCVKNWCIHLQHDSDKQDNSCCKLRQRYTYYSSKVSS